MKILVTGGVGKVGQWVVRKLLDGPAHEVTVLDRLPGPERGAVKLKIKVTKRRDSRSADAYHPLIEATLNFLN